MDFGGPLHPYKTLKRIDLYFYDLCSDIEIYNRMYSKCKEKLMMYRLSANGVYKVDIWIQDL